METEITIKTKTLEHLRELAYRAHTGTSFSPEKRAESTINDYSEELDKDLESLGSYPNNYKEKYIGYLTSWLNAKSNCISSMITGGSNFPVRRAEKANNSEHNRHTEFREWREHYFKNVERSEKKKQIEEAGGEVEVARKKLIDLEITQEYMKKINAGHKAYLKNPNSILNMDLTEENIKVITSFVPAYSYIKHPFAPYQLTNNNATIRNTKARIVELEKKEDNASGGNKEKAFKGGVLTYDYQLDRITIKHDVKPERAIIDELKSHGFKWSPHYSVWMRKITPNAIYVTEKLLLPKIEIK